MIGVASSFEQAATEWNDAEAAETIHRLDAADAPAGLGELLQAWRRRALLTQEQLAERAGLSARTIGRLERGIGTPLGASLQRLAAALELDAASRATLVDSFSKAEGAAHGTVPTVSAEPPEQGPIATPRQLPAAPPRFIGRLQEIAELERVVVQPGPVVIAIDGMAGIGKTALATHIAHAWSGRCPDGQLFIDLRGAARGTPPLDPSDALARLLRAMGVLRGQIPGDLADRAALYRSHLAKRRSLVLLDNAASEAQVASLLPGVTASLTIITSRRRLSGLDLTHIRSLGLLPPPEAVELLVQTSGHDGSGADRLEQLIETTELCGRLPLAIRSAAARLRSRPSWSIGHLNERLRCLQHRLVELGTGEWSVSAALDLSYMRLEPAVQHGYRLLSLHPGTDFDLGAASALVGRRPSRVQPLLDHLLDVHLLQEPMRGRFRFHDLTRAHAAGLVYDEVSESDRRAAMARLIEYTSGPARSMLGVVDPRPEDAHERGVRDRASDAQGSSARCGSPRCTGVTCASTAPTSRP